MSKKVQLPPYVRRMAHSLHPYRSPSTVIIQCCKYVQKKRRKQSMQMKKAKHADKVTMKASQHCQTAPRDRQSSNTLIRYDITTTHSCSPNSQYPVFLSTLVLQHAHHSARISFLLATNQRTYFVCLPRYLRSVLLACEFLSLSRTSAVSLNLLPNHLMSPLGP